MSAGERGINFYTLGYQLHSQLSLLNLLTTQRISVLVDVRQNPISRKRGFSKTHLEKGARLSGIDYFHAPHLGTPTAIRKQYAKSGNVKDALEAYEAYLRSRRKYLQSLLNRVMLRRFCLLCLERDYTSCHRYIIVQMLAEITGWQPTDQPSSDGAQRRAHDGWSIDRRI